MDDSISRRAALNAIHNCTDIYINNLPVMVDKADACKALAELPTAETDLSSYSDKLWKAAYERGMAEAQPRWIPVTEMLPEYGTQVLTIDKDGDCEINHVIDEEDGEWFSDGVIAWMPLPEPYKEGQE